MNSGFILLFHTESRAEYSAQMSTDLKEAVFRIYEVTVSFFFVEKSTQNLTYLP